MSSSILILSGKSISGFVKNNISSSYSSPEKQYFSEVNFVDVYAGGNLEIRTEVIGNDTGNISFSMVNVILKRYNL